MTSQVSIVTSTASKAVVVPIQSVVERIPGAKNTDDDEDDTTPRKKYVFLARDGKVRQVEVTTGISDATHVAILQGLKAGDPVVTGPFRTLKKLKDGEAVNVTKEPTSEKKDGDKE